MKQPSSHWVWDTLRRRIGDFLGRFAKQSWRRMPWFCWYFYITAWSWPCRRLQVKVPVYVSRPYRLTGDREIGRSLNHYIWYQWPHRNIVGYQQVYCRRGPPPMSRLPLPNSWFSVRYDRPFSLLITVANCQELWIIWLIIVELFLQREIGLRFGLRVLSQGAWPVVVRLFVVTKWAEWISQ